jgi:hypothetical protein
MEFNYGHLLEVGPSGSLNRYRFQNFAINARLRGPGEGTSMGLGSVYFEFPRFVRSGTFAEPFLFLPFSFGGAIATLSGDNLDATLQFANTTIARNFVVEALDNNYVAKVQTVLWSTEALVPPYAPGESVPTIEKVLYEYFGSCSAGGWDETRLQVKLNSVLDAVQTNVPGRRLRRQHVGNLPFTANVRV